MWEVWHARFDFQEGHGYKFRPVIVVGVRGDESLTMMVTGSTNKLHLEHDYPLRDWRETGEVKPKKGKGKLGRKRMGQEVFVPVTMKAEPSDLATINMIAKYSHRSRSDVMREVLSYGLAHMMGQAFGEEGSGLASNSAAPAQDEDGAGD